MKSSIKVIFIISLFVCVLVKGQANQNQECRCSCREPQRPTEQGRPGKKGPPGPPGPTGLRGIPGSCACNPNEINRLNSTIQSLIGEIKKLSTDYVWNQHVSPKFYVDFCSVGVKDGRVADAQMTASSVFSNAYAPGQGRLDYQGKSNPFRSGSWSAVRPSVGEWLQVDLLQPTFVTGVITQGRGGRHHFSQRVTSFKILFTNQTNSFQNVTNKMGQDMIFLGNNDQNTYVMNRFPLPITARYFRLVVQAWNGEHISVRLDYVTC